MSIFNYIKSNNLINEQVQYIFSAFQKAFPNTRIDDRKKILGIGEPDRFLMCYFIYSNDKYLVKFKCQENAILLPQEYENLDVLIKETIDLFNKNEFIKTGKRLRVYKKIGFNQYEKQLKTTNDLSQIKEEFLAKEEFFSQRLIEFKEIMRSFIDCFGVNEKKKHISYSLLQLTDEKQTLMSLAEQYGISRQAISLNFYKQLKIIAIRINLKTEISQEKFEVRNSFVDKLSDCIIDAFILFLKKRGNTHLARAFCVIFIPNNLRDTKDFMAFINGNNKYFIQPDVIKVRHNKFTVFVSRDGEFITDLQLLDKLAQLRSRLASEYVAQEKWIYSDKQLVLLATEKPTCKEEYFRVLNTDKGYENFGCVVVEEIVKHIK